MRSRATLRRSIPFYDKMSTSISSRCGQMTQPRKKKPTVDQVLKLVDQLSTEDRAQLMQELRAEDFRRDIQKGIDSADRGELKPAKEVLARLRKKAQTRL